MRMLAKNAGAVVTSQLLAQLWFDFLAEKSAEISERNGQNLILNSFRKNQRPIDGFKEETNFAARIREGTNV